MPSALFWLIGSCVVLNDVYSLAIDDDAIGYLRSYGYLPTMSNRFGDDIIHEDTATEALKNLQRIGHIRETGVLDDATKALLRKPRCGNRDFEITQNTRRRRKKRYALGPTKWDRLNLTWKFTNKNSPRNEKQVGQIRRLIYEAMAIWQHNSNLKLTEVRVDDADILIDFARGNHGDNFEFQGPGGSLAHAFYPGTGLSGDVHLDDDESWDIEDGKGGDVSFFYTLLHELGHSLGLAHSSETESIMYPWYSSSRTLDRGAKELYEDDIIGIEQIYGPKNGERRWGPIKVRKTTRRITTTTTRQPQTQRPEEPTTTQLPIPDRCNTSYDAIAVIRNELMVFKGPYMWRFHEQSLLSGYPAKFSRMWTELEEFDHLDAVFEKLDGKFVFFSGRDVIVVDTNRKVHTHNLEYLGFHRRVEKIDAIIRWGHNNKTFIFSGDEYWGVDDDLHVMEREMKRYPQKIKSVWQRLTAIKIDTAFQVHGITYFFSDRMTYKFNDSNMTLDLQRPEVSSEKWMGCRYTEEEITSIQKSARVQDNPDFETSSATETIVTSTAFTVFTLLMAISNML